MATLAGPILLISPLLALVFSTNSFSKGDRKWYTLVTLVIAGALTLWIACVFLMRLAYLLH